MRKKPKIQAIKDINRHLKEMGVPIKGVPKMDFWVISGNRIDTKEQENLNKQLNLIYEFE